MPFSVFNPESVSLLNEALREFDCEAPTSLAPLPDRNRERRLAKRDKVTKTVQRFEALMNGPNPPATEAEMLAALTPVVAWVLSWFIRQLVIEVLRFCWRRWNS